MRVNGQIHAYAFRGPKKYPGRVMPPDITDKVLLTPNARNRVEFVYSGSVKEYVLTVAYCERVSIESLVASLDNKVLSKEKVIAQREWLRPGAWPSRTPSSQTGMLTPYPREHRQKGRGGR